MEGFKVDSKACVEKRYAHTYTFVPVKPEIKLIPTNIGDSKRKTGKWCALLVSSELGCSEANIPKC